MRACLSVPMFSLLCELLLSTACAVQIVTSLLSLCPCACVCYSPGSAVLDPDERVQACAMQELASVLQTALDFSEHLTESESDSGKSFFFDMEELEKLAGLLDQPLCLVTSKSSDCIVKYVAWSLLYVAHYIVTDSGTAESKMLRVTFIFVSLCRCWYYMLFANDGRKMTGV